MVEKIVYECEHCNKKQLKTRGGMAGHELICWHNLANKTCMTCKFGALVSSDENDYERVRKCFVDSKEGETFQGIRPVENCKKWECSDEYLEKYIKNTEPLTNESIRDICLKFNELGYWCSINLLLDTGTLYLLVKENDELKSLVHKSNIASMELNTNDLGNTELNVEFNEEDKNGFLGFVIDKNGIVY